jgi:hypothetical protein
MARLTLARKIAAITLAVWKFSTTNFWVAVKSHGDLHHKSL